MSQQFAEFYAKITADFTELQKGLDTTKAKLDGLSKQTTGTGGAVEGLAGKLSGLINPTTLMISAATGLAVYLKNATAAAAESAQVDAKLAAVLRATGNSAGLSAEEIDSMASSLSKMSGVDDEVIKSGAAVLATFREVGEDVFPQAMQAALDMSAVMGTDLQGSIMQIGKALNDPIGGASALRRAGVQLTDQQQEQIKAFVASGDVMKAQGIILQELGMEFGGAAESMNDAGDGSANLKVSLGNLSEYIGSKMLPNIRDANEETANWIDTLLESLEASDRVSQAYYEQFEAGQKVVDQYWEGSKTTAEYSEEVRRVGAELYRSQNNAQAWGVALENATVTTEDASAATAKLNAGMDMLAGYMSTDLTDAQNSYNEKIGEYTKQLEEARTAEERQGIQDKIEAETEAYNRRAASIIFNIQQEAILASATTAEQKAAALPILTELANSYGLINEQQVQLMGSTNNLVALWSTGQITAEQFTAGLSNMGNSAISTSSAEAELAQKTYNVQQKTIDAAAVLPKFDQEQTKLGNNIRSDSLPAVKGLANGLSSMPLTGTSWSYLFKITTIGKIPSVPKRGTNKGPGAGYENNVGVDSEFGASGGQMDGKWTIVGDAPGGRWTPYTEVISPTGYVYNAEESKALKASGLLDGAMSMYFGGEGPGVVTGGASEYIFAKYATKPKTKQSSRRETRKGGNNGDGNGGGNLPLAVSDAVLTEMNNSQAALQETMVAAMQSQAAVASMQNSALNKKLDELIGVMTSSNPRAIGNEIGYQIARRS